jgi:hypothetical protein
MVGISAWNMLVRCKIAGKNIMVFGDNTHKFFMHSVLIHI